MGQDLEKSPIKKLKKNFSTAQVWIFVIGRNMKMGGTEKDRRSLTSTISFKVEEPN